jgi:hypothetical protein
MDSRDSADPVSEKEHVMSIEEKDTMTQDP